MSNKHDHNTLTQKSKWIVNAVVKTTQKSSFLKQNSIGAYDFCVL